MFENFYFMYTMYFIREIFGGINIFSKSILRKMFMH